ncbi:MAG: acyl dehydratase [Pseudomonadales bacterium]|jgi:2-methylfumaryl-CoA hydratase|nr:acyl dehydratase [Pseudomonadales bacterium]
MTVVPWFEDFSVGDDLSAVPSVTVTEGYAAAHQMVFADRARLALDWPLAKAVTGSDTALVNPSLVCNIAIGQSTIPTQRVLGNLFYRGLRFQRPVFLGDTLTTKTKVVALRQNAIKPGRAASGMVGLEIHVTNQRDETVLLFWRCPMVPCKDKDADTGLADDLSTMPETISEEDLLASVPDWQLQYLPSTPREFAAGETVSVEARDTVTSAPEVVRMTLNMAMTHTDAGRSVYGKRLVYGGHTISLAAAQLSRVLPSLATILCWYKCDHVAPVFEQDILSSVIHVRKETPVPGGRILDLGIDVFAERGSEAPEPGEGIKVLDWQMAVLVGGEQQ